MEINAWSLLSFLHGNVLFENAGNLFFLDVGVRNMVIYSRRNQKAVIYGPRSY